MDEFVSTFTNRLDAKGRVSIPAQFRAVLAVDGFDGLYCCPTLDQQAIDAGGNRLRDRIRASLGNFEPFSEDHELLSTTLIGDSEILKVDGDGRVVLSEPIKAHAGISERVTFVGQGYKFQIWEPERFAAYREEAKNRLRDLRKRLVPVHRAAGAGGMMAGRGTQPDGVAGGPARHVPVLLDEVMRNLAPEAGGTFIDGTFGAGGYSRAILATGASVLAIDRDPEAVAGGAPLAAEYRGRLTLVEGRFSDLDAIAREHGHEKVDGVVLDVGVSSMQLDRPERGFSFRQGGPLDMRMGNEGPTAADIVNAMERRDLARVIAVLGEEKKAGFVARAIETARSRTPIATTNELADIVAQAVGRRHTDTIHPATRTFQALRIFVNRELDELAEALAASERILAEGGRLVVVAFHSLEDRIVKRFLGERSEKRARASRHMPEATVEAPTFELLVRGAVMPGEDEINANPRARSARLRAARRTAAPARPIDAGSLGVPELPAFEWGRA